MPSAAGFSLLVSGSTFNASKLLTSSSRAAVIVSDPTEMSLFFRDPRVRQTGTAAAFGYSTSTYDQDGLGSRDRRVTEPVNPAPQSLEPERSGVQDGGG
jgi:hypothetical protein